MVESARARLFCPIGACRGARFDITGEATVGRGEGHAVRLDQQAISKDHARIAFDPDAGCFVLEDLGSTNGTTLDGIPVAGRERLGHLHVITFAERHEFVFQDLGRCAARHGDGAARVAASDARTSVEETRATSMPLPIPGVLDRPVTTPSANGAAESGLEEPREHTEVVQVPLAIPGALDRPAATDDAAEAQVVAAVEAAAGAEPREHTEVVRIPPAVPDLIDRPTTVDTAGDSAMGDGTLADDTAADHPETDGAADRSARYGTRKIAPPSPADAAPPADDRGRSEPPPGRITDTDASGVILGEKTPYRLEITLDDGEIRRFPLCSGDNLVGRGRGADVRLDSRHLSRRHAVLRILGSTITLRDEGSRNHTFLEGQRIGAAVPIEPGDRLRFGGIEARLLMGGSGS